jgi:phenylacetic acid degradation operon negative regulatory protein
VREEMTLLGFGQLQPGLFASPTRTPQDTLATLRELGVAEDVLVTRATTFGNLADERIARTAWDLDELGRRYRDFVELFVALEQAVAGARTIPADAAFAVRTLLIHEYRKIHLRDPLLPSSLLPANFAGRRAGELCRSLYARLFQPAEKYLSTEMRTSAGALPSPSAETYRRFGGLRAR